jgi:hypothetical protein
VATPRGLERDPRLHDMPTHYLPPRRGACKDAAALERVLGLVLWLGLCFVLVGA